MHKWTKFEIEILKHEFPNGGIYKCLELLPYLSKTQIKNKLESLKIRSNRYKSWTDEEIELLYKVWETASSEDLEKLFPNRKLESLQNKANALGLKCKVNRQNKNNLKILDLENLTPNTAYWWGYIMADGHISERSIICNSKDKEYLMKLSNLLNAKIHCRNYINQYNGKMSEIYKFSVDNKNLISKWRSILNIENSAKTYFPPNLNVFNNLFIYFFIGFVDGDGCIWNPKYPALKIELHKSWLSNLEWMKTKLHELGFVSAKTKIGNKNTAVLTIGNRDDIINISSYCKEVDYMERKWDFIINYKKKKEYYENPVLDLETNIKYKSISECCRLLNRSKCYIKHHKERFLLSYVH